MLVELPTNIKLHLICKRFMQISSNAKPNSPVVLISGVIKCTAIFTKKVQRAIACLPEVIRAYKHNLFFANSCLMECWLTLHSFSLSGRATNLLSIGDLFESEKGQFSCSCSHAIISLIIDIPFGLRLLSSGFYLPELTKLLIGCIDKRMRLFRI